MFSIYQGHALTETNDLSINGWFHISRPTPEEIAYLRENIPVDFDYISDAMDINEQSRVETFDNGFFIVLRIPVKDKVERTPFRTVPLAVICIDQKLLTFCTEEEDVTAALLRHMNKTGGYAEPITFILKIILVVAESFQICLRDIFRISQALEQNLKRTIRNTALHRLLSLEKSLLYFTTSLKSNETLIKRLSIRLGVRFDEPQEEIFEDIVTENLQALEMSRIYQRILADMMNVFSSIINNNLNNIMKRLTAISIVLMLPTLVTSFYGMNVNLPLAKEPMAFAMIIGVSVLFSSLTVLWLKIKRSL